MKTIAWMAILAASVPTLADTGNVEDRPNILLILADDLGYSDLGCYGGEMDTPNTDGLASAGIRSTKFYNSARCCPSRASLMTGLYPSQAGIGIIVAQGGREHGYAVHLLNGKLAFDVRVNGKVTRTISDEPAPQALDFEARLTSDSITLDVNGRTVAKATSPGLIPVQPKDRMTIGRDELTAAGDYTPPNPLRGTVRNLKATMGERNVTRSEEARY